MAQRLQHYRRQHAASLGKSDTDLESEPAQIVLRSTN
jgi:hypothetical protein